MVRDSKYPSSQNDLNGCHTVALKLVQIGKYAATELIKK